MTGYHATLKSRSGGCSAFRWQQRDHFAVVKTGMTCGPRLVHRARKMVTEYMRPDPSRPEK